MTHASARIGTSHRRAFRLAASQPGLFDGPDRALAAMRSLAEDADARTTNRLDRLSELLRVHAGTRFWTEGSMREYVGLVNEVLDDLGRQIRLDSSGPARLGVKSSNRSSGRYSLFRLRIHPSGADKCRRNLPGGLSPSGGPS